MTFYVKSLPLTGFKDLRVVDLFNVNGCAWIRDLVEDFLALDDAKCVLQIPISYTPTTDRLI